MYMHVFARAPVYTHMPALMRVFVCIHIMPMSRPMPMCICVRVYVCGHSHLRLCVSMCSCVCVFLGVHAEDVKTSCLGTSSEEALGGHGNRWHFGPRRPCSQPRGSVDTVSSIPSSFSGWRRDEKLSLLSLKHGQCGAELAILRHTCMLQRGREAEA